MKYSDFQISDFLKDEFFMKWVKGNDPHVDDFWKKWLIIHPEKTQLVVQAKELILCIKYKETHELTTEEYVNMHEEILKKSKIEFKINPSQKFSFVKIAVSILLITALFYSLWVVTGNHNKQEIAHNADVIIEKSTLPGQKLTFKLPDGTSVKLNAASSLRFTQSADDNSIRQIYLEGEAFFDVTRDLNRPFVVMTPELSTTALGTSFNISAYLLENKQTVSLLTGRVLVKKTFGSSEESEYLIPGDQVLFNKSEDDFQKVQFDADRELAWSNGIIVFEDTDFEHVISRLGRWYGVQFEIINENKKIKDTFSGTFENETLEKVLNILSFSGGFEYTIKENIVTIEFSN